MLSEQAFADLLTFLRRFNALDFLSQFSMTYLFSPDERFTSESDPIHTSALSLEFACGFYATEMLLPTGEVVDQAVLEDFRTLWRTYFDAINSGMIVGVDDNPRTSRSPSLMSARIHSLHVRGDAYPHQFWELTKQIYCPHNEWFARILGFTIQDAISIGQAIEEELNDRYASRKSSSQLEALQLVKTQRERWVSAGMTEEQARLSAHAQLFFGRAKDLYRITAPEVAHLTSLPTQTIIAFFARLSQQPPYRNALFENTFTTNDQALWDYNTIRERPFFTDGSGYWLFMPHTLKEVLYATFFFDLMADRTYKPSFEDSRGKVLEGLAATYLRRVFPPECVFVNPAYPNGEEFADVCVIYDSQMLIVQCKSKTLTLAAHQGQNEEALKRDLQHAIRDAVAQGCRSRVFIESEATPYIVHEGRTISIQKDKITSVSLVALTYMPLHSFATRIREVEDDLQLTHSNYPAWALPVVDLDIVTQICTSPAELMHYVGRRLLLEEGGKSIHGDEMDLLAFYLEQGLWLVGEDMEAADLIAVSGYSRSIDEYIFERYSQQREVAPPRVARTEDFRKLIATIQLLPVPFRTNCALMLLDTSGEAGTQVIEMIARTKARCVERGDTIPSNVGNDSSAWGLSFVATPLSISAAESAQRAMAYAALKKYQLRIEKWVGLGWHLGSPNIIDVAYWLPYPYEADPEMEAISERVASQRL